MVRLVVLLWTDGGVAFADVAVDGVLFNRVAVACVVAGLSSCCWSSCGFSWSLDVEQSIRFLVLELLDWSWKSVPVGVARKVPEGVVANHV